MANDVPERSAEERAGEISRRRVRRWLWGATAGTILLCFAAPAWRYYRIASALNQIAAACRPGEFGPSVSLFSAAGPATWGVHTKRPPNYYVAREPDWFPESWWPFSGYSPFALVVRIHFHEPPLDPAAALAPLAMLPGLEAAHLHAPFPPAALRRLAECRGLTTLDVGSAVTSEHLAAIAEILALEVLVLWDADVSGAEFELLAGCTNLRELIINSIGGIVPEQLAALSVLPNLTALTVISGDLDTQCVDALCRLDRLTKLQVASDLTAAQLVRLMQLPNLRTLIISSNHVVSPSHFHAAERSPSLTNLRLNEAWIKLEPRVSAGDP